MPKTSVFCLRAHKYPHGSRACRQEGFTLLELMVVLALVAALVGLAAPAVLRGLDAARERGLASDLESLLAGLPVQAFQQGAPLTLDAKQLRTHLKDLPAEWQLSVDPEALHYGSTGVAKGAVVSLRAPGLDTKRWRILPITGEVERTR